MGSQQHCASGRRGPSLVVARLFRKFGDGGRRHHRAYIMMAPGQSDAGGGASAPSPKAKRASPPSSLTGIAVVWRAFLFLDGPAEVLRASTANHRWHELATADSVWREKARRESILEKAGVFEVALPSVAAEEEDEAAGVGLAFYAAVFVLKVWLA